ERRYGTGRSGRRVFPALRASASERRTAVPDDRAPRARGDRMTRRALITGVGGQDGSFLAELLLDRGYEVFGVVRRSGSSYPNLGGVRDRIELIQADPNDQLALVRALRACGPHEVYN